MRKLLYSLLLLAVTAPAFSATTFYRAHDEDSVVLGPICIPEAAGVELYDVDFNTTNLTITIYASGDGVDTSYVYTGANIDDYDGTPPAWGNPPASAVEVEDDDECIRLHIRDEVLAVASAKEWTIKFTDSTTDNIMDWEVQVLAINTVTDVQSGLATSAALATAQTDLDTITGTNGVLIDDNAITEEKTSAGYVTEVQNGIATAASLSSLTDAVVLATGTCDSGSTTTCVDAVRTEADDVWKGAEIVFTSGTAAAETSCVYDFVASSDTLTFWATVGSAGTGDYILKANALCESATDESP